MALSRPTITFVAILSLITILFSSCTITQRRYRSGFHLEWQHRYKAQESDQANGEKEAVSAIEQVKEEPVLTAGHSIRAVEEEAVIVQQENVPQPQMVDHSFPLGKIKPVDIALQNEEMNGDSKPGIVTRKGSQHKREDQSWWLLLLGILFGLVVLVMPPLLFSVGAYWLDVSAVELVFIWLIWIGGIACVFWLFSGLWPIILSCLIWNVVFMIAAFALTVT
ncbi:MAG TPA: hypothetical protein VK151_07235 [Fluviicola sp.]|nr:hypothetical protein [Fluviicola sp.]